MKQNNKETYLAPECEELESKPEGVFCVSGGLEDNMFEFETL